MALNNIILISRGLFLNKLPKVNFISPTARSVATAAFSFSTCDDSSSPHRRCLHVLSNHSATIGQHGQLTMNLVSRRFKKTKSRGSKKVEEEDEEEDDDDDTGEENPLLMEDILDKPVDGRQRLTLDVGSLRLDAIGKMGFSITRQKMEELFYKGDVYVNGVRATKKSQDIYVGDEIDIVMQTNTEDRNKVDVKRIQVVEMPDKATEQGRMKLTIDRWMGLTVDLPARNE